MIDNYEVVFKRCTPAAGKNYTRWTILKNGKKYKYGTAKTDAHAIKRASTVLTRIGIPVPVIN